MTHPILKAIDDALVSYLPAGVEARANDEVLAVVRDEIGDVTHHEVTIHADNAVFGSWRVLSDVAYLRPEEDSVELHPRDPDTGQFVAREG